MTRIVLQASSGQAFKAWVGVNNVGVHDFVSVDPVHCHQFQLTTRIVLQVSSVGIQGMGKQNFMSPDPVLCYKFPNSRIVSQASSGRAFKVWVGVKNVGVQIL